MKRSLKDTTLEIFEKRHFLNDKGKSALRDSKLNMEYFKE